ncbi:unnamed protein product [Protopolystoma xenopodis]|uniref:MI domain-containing protein n=1 Tax=Protopolystoma xenopodis TaxID=117903 RepID=A0A3S5ARI6_9PLAT|nr:unnamed protein product [Protopolystoma xenopodis]
MSDDNFQSHRSQTNAWNQPLVPKSAALDASSANFPRQTASINILSTGNIPSSGTDNDFYVSSSSTECYSLESGYHVDRKDLREKAGFIDEIMQSLSDDKFDQEFCSKAFEKKAFIIVYGLLVNYLDQRRPSSVGKAISRCLSSKLLTLNDIKCGFQHFLKDCILDDIATDVPFLWDYLAEVLDIVLSANSDDLSLLDAILFPLKPEMCRQLFSLDSGQSGAKFAAKTLSLLAARTDGNDALINLLARSRLSWTSLGLAQDQVSSFLSGYHLDFLAFAPVTSASILTTLPTSLAGSRPSFGSVLTSSASGGSNSASNSSMRNEKSKGRRPSSQKQYASVKSLQFACAHRRFK